jgi:hypothetical protein
MTYSNQSNQYGAWIPAMGHTREKGFFKYINIFLETYNIIIFLAGCRLDKAAQKLYIIISKAQNLKLAGRRRQDRPRKGLARGRGTQGGSPGAQSSQTGSESGG